MTKTEIELSLSILKLLPESCKPIVNHFANSCVFDVLYSKEIDFEIITRWDSGFHWQLRDGGSVLATGSTMSMQEAAAQLMKAAMEHPRTHLLFKDE